MERPRKTKRIEKAINISYSLKKRLSQAGVMTLEDLKSLGSREAFLKIRDFCDGEQERELAVLLALEGAIQGVHSHFIAEKEKGAFMNFLSNLPQQA